MLEDWSNSEIQWYGHLESFKILLCRVWRRLCSSSNCIMEFGKGGYSSSSDNCGGLWRNVEIYFSGSNHYTSIGVVVRTTKINFNIKEAEATLFTPVLLRVPQCWPNRSGLRTLAHQWIITHMIITLDFTTIVGFELWSIGSLAFFMLKFILVVLTTKINFNKECIPWQIGDLLWVKSKLFNLYIWGLLRWTGLTSN